MQLNIPPFLYHIPDRSYSPSFWPNTCTIIGTDRIPCMPSLISNDIINVHNSRTELYRSSKFSWHEVYENNLVTPVFLSSYTMQPPSDIKTWHNIDRPCTTNTNLNAHTVFPISISRRLDGQLINHQIYLTILDMISLYLNKYDEP